MKVSVQWLKDLVPDLSLATPALAESLTEAGLEVESIEPALFVDPEVVVAEVLGVRATDEDALEVTLSDGDASPKTVLCTDGSIQVGEKVAWARPGARVGERAVTERTLRDVRSEGMLCSAAELGIGQDGDAVLRLSRRAAPGRSVAKVLGLKDVVLTLGVTPNRSDALSHLGVARELAAATGSKLKAPTDGVDEAERSARGAIKISVEAKALCPTYQARVIEGVTVGPSPEWVQRRLLAVGLRPISNVVDATNYVMMTLGQPLHAFDLDRITGPVTVRTAGAGASAELLDGSTRALVADDLVIADANGVIALAGVMGGASSEVAGDTRRVLLESAIFAPATVRRTARRLALHSEASHRFERGVDPEMVGVALDRAAALIAEWSGGAVLRGVLGARPKATRPRVVWLRPPRAADILGRPVSAADARRCLKAYRVVPAKGVASSKKKGIAFEVPSWRHDLRGEEDLIEEVGRSLGFDGIPLSLPARPVTPSPMPRAARVDRALRQSLAGLGFTECISLAFGSDEDVRHFGPVGAQPVALQNPLGEESRFLRCSLVPGLIRTVRRNQDHVPSLLDLQIFELGVGFHWAGAGPLPVERELLALALRGRRHPSAWCHEDAAADFFDLKGRVVAVGEALGLEAPSWRAPDTAPDWLQPGVVAELVDGEGGSIGWAGQLQLDVAAAYGLKGPPLWCAELDWGRWRDRKGVAPTFVRPSRYPAARRDLSFYVPEAVPYGALQARIRGAVADLPFSTEVQLFDVYAGRGVPEGRRSLALALVFRADGRTLKEDEVAAAQDQIVTALTDGCDAVLRDAG